MSDKASGNESEKQNSELDDLDFAIPEEREISVDPSAGDLLDPVEHWWKEELGVGSGAVNTPVKRSEDSEEIETPAKEETNAVAVSPESIKPLTPIIPEDEEEDEDELDGLDEIFKEEEEKGEVVEEKTEETAAPLNEEDFSEIIAKKEPEKSEGENEEGELVSDEETPVVLGKQESEEEKEVLEGPKLETIEEPGEDEEATETDEDEANGTVENDSEESTDVEDDKVEAEAEKEKKAPTPDAEEIEAEGDGSEEEDTEAKSSSTLVFSDISKKEHKASEVELEEELEPEAAVVVAAVSEAPAKRKGGCWTIFLNLFFFSSLLVFVALAIGALWVWSKLSNLEYEIVQQVQPALAEQGIFFEYGGWRYQYPRGLVIEGITLFETEQLEKPVLRASDLGVNVDFLSLIQDQSSPVSAEISFDQSVLTFFQDAQELGSITELTGEVFANQTEVDIRSLAAQVEGLAVVVRGDIQLPEKKGEGGEEADLDAGKEKTFALDLSPITKVLPWLYIESEGAPPEMRLDFSFDSEAPEAAKLSASLNGNRFRWEDVMFTSASVAAEYNPETKALDFSTFQIGYGEGILGGKMSLDTETRVLTVEQIQSTVDLLAFASELDADVEEALAGLTFVDAPNVKMSGQVPLDDPKLARLSVNYDHRQGLLYTKDERALPVRDLRGSFDFNQGILETNDFAGNVLDGNVAINGSIRLTAEGTPFSGLIEVESMPLAKVAEYYGKGDLGMTGNIFFDFRGIGYSEVSKIRGGGTIRVDGARLPAFPVIGPVQKFLGTVIPAFGIQGEGSLTGAYIIESGTLLTNDLTVAQAGAQLVTNGNLMLEKQYVRFTTKASLQPTLARATGLEEKVIEVSGEGDLTDPSLSLAGFPTDFASDKLSEVLGTSPETLQGLKGMLSGEEEDVAKILGAPLEEALGEELGEGVRGLFEGILGGGEPPAPEVANPVAPDGE